jgi:hypothetical protein
VPRLVIDDGTTPVDLFNAMYMVCFFMIDILEHWIMVFTGPLDYGFKKFLVQPIKNLVLLHSCSLTNL